MNVSDFIEATDPTSDPNQPDGALVRAKTVTDYDPNGTVIAVKDPRGVVTATE
jgi:hypothetical protein